jgi:RHS repeat-associated protein
VGATATVTYTYNPVYSRVAMATDGVGTTSYAYYPPGVLGAGRLQSVDGPLDNDTITYSYDELGRVDSKQIGASSRTEAQAFDALGRLTALTNPLGTFTYTYDGVSGRTSSVTYPNGQQTTYTYYGSLGDHRLEEIHNRKPGGATLSKFNYTYDTVGNILTWRQQNESSPAQVYEYGYDNADQLTAAILKSTDPTPVTLKRYYYGYDPAGNRTAEQVDDAVRSWTYNNMNQLVTEQAGGALIFKGTLNEPATVTVGGRPAAVTADNRFAGSAVVPSGTGQVAVAARDMAGNLRTNTYQVAQSGATRSFTFDANGNMTSDGTKTYTWDAENRLVEIKQGTITLASFVYNKDGIRASKTAGGLTTTYVLEGDSLVEERAGSGGTIKHFQGTSTDNVLASIDASAVPSYYVRDHLASIRQSTNASGQVVLTREYDPWGNPLAGAGATGWSFTGREWEPETSLHYYRARYYDSALARFLSSDPIGLAGGANRYLYVQNRPVVANDPTGHVLQVCTRWARRKPTGSQIHMFLKWPRPDGDQTCGRMNTDGEKDQCSDEPQCTDVPGSEGKEEQVMDCCRRHANDPVEIWLPTCSPSGICPPKAPDVAIIDTGLPFVNDCYSQVKKCLARNDLTFPPGVRSRLNIRCVAGGCKSKCK